MTKKGRPEGREWRRRRKTRAMLGMIHERQEAWRSPSKRVTSAGDDRRDPPVSPGKGTSGKEYPWVNSGWLARRGSPGPSVRPFPVRCRPDLPSLHWGRAPVVSYGRSGPNRTADDDYFRTDFPPARRFGPYFLANQKNCFLLFDNNRLAFWKPPPSQETDRVPIHRCLVRPVARDLRTLTCGPAPASGPDFFVAMKRTGFAPAQSSACTPCPPGPDHPRSGTTCGRGTGRCS